jgi:hypothetical protein
MSNTQLKPGKLISLGHTKMSALKAIRLRCLDCCVESAHEVALCPAVKCASWPFRLGHNPWVGENLMRSHRPPLPTSPPRLRAEPPASALELSKDVAVYGEQSP